MDFLPKELEDIIFGYRNQIEHYEKFSHCLKEIKQINYIYLEDIYAGETTYRCLYNQITTYRYIPALTFEVVPFRASLLVNEKVTGKSRIILRDNIYGIFDIVPLP